MIIGVSGDKKKLTQTKKAQNSRINKLKQQEKLQEQEFKINQKKNEATLIAIREERESIKSIKKIVKKMKSGKSWKRIKQSEKETFWSMIYQKCRDMNVNSNTFWSEFSKEIADDVKMPPEKSGDRRLLKKSYCPFSITTQDSSQYYFIKLISLDPGKELHFFFKGEYFKSKVAPGSYRFKYCYGSQWHGEGLLFGPDKNYFESDDTLNFSVERFGNRISYSGQRITLIKQIHGNFDTKSIDENTF